jgi:hypothetical protein
MSFRENREAMWLEQRRFDYSPTDQALDNVRARTLVLWGNLERGRHVDRANRSPGGPGRGYR